MAVCQSFHFYLTHRYRGQAPSHIQSAFIQLNTES